MSLPPDSIQQRSKDITAIKAAIRERDGYACVRCGITADEYRKRPKKHKTLDVHRKIPGSPYSLDGCVTLCRSCHRLTHGCDIDGPTKTIKLEPDVYNRLMVIAKQQGISIHRLASDLLRPIVFEVYCQLVDALQAEWEAEKGKRKGK